MTLPRLSRLALLTTEAEVAALQEPRHREPCGCVYVSIDVPDDQWYGQGWKPIDQCTEHAG